MEQIEEKDRYYLSDDYKKTVLKVWRCRVAAVAACCCAPPPPQPRSSQTARPRGQLPPPSPLRVAHERAAAD